MFDPHDPGLEPNRINDLSFDIYEFLRLFLKLYHMKTYAFIVYFIHVNNGNSSRRNI